MLDLEYELRNCFQIKQPADHQFEVQLSLPATLTYYHGHFPEIPVLPAVAFLDISQYFLTKCFQIQSLKIQSVPSIKIKKILSPETSVHLLLEKQNDQQFSVHWQNYAVLNLNFAP